MQLAHFIKDQPSTKSIANLQLKSEGASNVPEEQHSVDAGFILVSLWKQSVSPYKWEEIEEDLVCLI